MDSKITVIESKRKTLSIEIKSNGSVFVHAPMFVSDSEIDDFVKSKNRWIEKHLKGLEQKRQAVQNTEKLSDEEIAKLKRSAEEYIPNRVDFYAEKIGVTYGKISIKLHKSRWGSCSAKKNLNFNCLLMLAPDDVIDSVVVHELCHLKEMNHSERFYRLVIRHFPNYYICNNWLKKNGTEILSRAFNLFN